MEHPVRIAERKLAPAEGIAAGLATDSTGGDDEEQRGDRRGCYPPSIP